MSRTGMLSWLGAMTLCGCTVFARGGSDDLATLERPIRVSVEFAAESRRVVGQIHAWNHEFVEFAPKGQEPLVYAWTELVSSDAYDTLRRLLPRDDARGWLLLGATMLMMGDQARAERAFEVAMRLDDGADVTVAKMRAADSGGDDPRDVLQEASGDQQQSRMRDGDGIVTSAAPVDLSGAVQGFNAWPELTEQERAEAVAWMRQDVRRKLSQINSVIEPIETDHFLMYTDLPDAEARHWAGQLDKMYRVLLKMLDMPEDARLFHGKCAILIFRNRQDFIDFERIVFQYAAARVGGLCHQRGSHVYVVFYKREDPAEFNSILIHEAVHAFMYRYKSPARLPAWADEGLAEYVAGLLVARSSATELHWKHVQRFVANSGQSVSIMRQRYDDGTWYTEDSYPVSHMLVKFMVENTRSGSRKGAFRKWIDDVKIGQPWAEALHTRFGTTQEELARAFESDVRQRSRAIPLE